MSILPDTQNCGLRMRRECRGRFFRHRLQRKPLFNDPRMHYGMCVTHMPWCMSRSLTRGGGENVPSIPGGCATRDFAYLVRGPWEDEPVNRKKPTGCQPPDLSWTVCLISLLTGYLCCVMIYVALVIFKLSSEICKVHDYWEDYAVHIKSIPK